MKKIKNILLILSIILTFYFSLGFKRNNEPCEKIDKCKCSFHNKHNLKNTINFHNYNMFFQMNNFLSLSIENKSIKKAGCSLCYSSLSFSIEKDITILVNNSEKNINFEAILDENQKILQNNSHFKPVLLTGLKNITYNIKSVKLNC